MSDTVSTKLQRVWRPSAARVLVLDSFLPTPRGTAAPKPLAWPAKDPQDVLDYQFDIAPAVQGNDGDAVASLDVSIKPADPGDLSLASAAADGARCVLWLAGGHAGTTYSVTLRVGTQAGRTLSRSVLLPVLALSEPAVAADALMADQGGALTDENGRPLFTGGE